MDARRLDMFNDNQFDVVLDKGCLDSILCHAEATKRAIEANKVA